jgi:hypothetical protein
MNTTGRSVRSSVLVSRLLSCACSASLRSAISSGRGRLSGMRSLGSSQCAWALSVFGEIASDMASDTDCLDRQIQSPKRGHCNAGLAEDKEDICSQQLKFRADFC